MKRTNFVTKLISALLFMALLAYLGTYIYGSLTNDIRTVPAVYVEMVDSVSTSGIVVRREQLIISRENYISVSADNGQMMASGESVATAYSGEAALKRAKQIRELELRRQYIITARSGGPSGAQVKGRESSIKSAISALTAAAARGEADAVSNAAITLQSLVMDSADIYTTQADLDLVNSEIASLKQTAAIDTRRIEAPSSGLFFASVDGYEYLSPKDLEGITPEKLRELFDLPRPNPEGVVGKIVSPLDWYYAALVPLESAQRLAVGESAALDFGRYCSQNVEATVTGIQYHRDGDCAVIFRCTGAAAEMLYARRVSAQIIFNSISGIRVPKNTVYAEDLEVKNEETGETSVVNMKFVYTVTGLQAEKKYINVIWESEEYYLAEIVSSDPNSLRAGNDIILTDKEIHDGMLLE